MYKSYQWNGRQPMSDFDHKFWNLCNIILIVVLFPEFRSTQWKPGIVKTFLHFEIHMQNFDFGNKKYDCIGLCFKQFSCILCIFITFPWNLIRVLTIYINIKRIEINTENLEIYMSNIDNTFAPISESFYFTSNFWRMRM